MNSRYWILNATIYNPELHLHDVMCFVNNERLTDAAISFYMRLLQERSERNEYKLRLGTLDSNFVKRVGETTSYEASTVDISNLDLLLIPIHVNSSHWIMAAIRIAKETIELYDSVEGSYELHQYGILSALAVSMIESSKRHDSFWRFSSVQCPQQANFIDCGVFALTVAEHLSRNVELSFNQSDMPRLRQRIAIDILRERIDSPAPPQP